MKKHKKGSKLQNIPGVGPKIEADLMDIGITITSDLEGRNPEDLYERLSAVKGQPIDQCVLYMFRCAVYYAENEKHDPELLKWWNWKDKTDIK